MAHNDLDLITKATALPLTPASRNDVSSALESIVKVLDVVSKHYTGSTNMFTWGGNGATDGAVALLHVLRDGVRARDERYARWERDEIDARDMPSNDDVQDAAGPVRTLLQRTPRICFAVVTIALK